MQRRVRFRREAEAELQEAFDWYVDRSPLVAARFLRKVRELLKRMATTPGQFPRLDPPDRTAIVERFPYYFVFDDDGDDIEVLAFCHDKREPGYWRDRVD